MKRVLTTAVVLILLGSVASGATAYEDTSRINPDNVHLNVDVPDDLNVTSDDVAEHIYVDDGDTDNVSIWFNDLTFDVDNRSGRLGGTVNGDADETTTFYIDVEDSPIDLEETEFYLYKGGEKQELTFGEHNDTDTIQFTVTTTGENESFKIVKPSIADTGEDNEFEADEQEVEDGEELDDVDVDDSVLERVQNQTHFREHARERIRVQSNVSGNASVAVAGNDTNSAEFAISNTENVSRRVYIQEDLVREMVPSASDNLTNVAALLDGDQTDYGIVQSNGTSWVVVEIDHFSTRHLEFVAVTGSTGGGTLGIVSSILGFDVTYLLVALGVIGVVAMIWFLQRRRTATTEATYVK